MVADVLNDLEIQQASQRLRDSLPPPSKSRRTLSQKDAQLLIAQAGEMIQSGDFRRAGARHLVGLWAWCHERTYGVAPAMTGREWTQAGFAAGSLLKSDFDGKAEQMVPFLRWTWAEERRAHEWRQENGRTSNPLGWRLQFSRRHVVKWRSNGGAR